MINNPNCSELVVRICNSTVKNYRDVVKQIISTNELSAIAIFVIRDEALKISITLPNGSHKFIKSAKNNNGAKIYRFDGKAFAEKTNDKLLIAAMKYWDRNKGEYDASDTNIRIAQNPKNWDGWGELSPWNITKMSCEFDEFESNQVSLYENCGFDSRKITASTGDHEVPSYPVIYKLSEIFSEEAEGQDGGSTFEYDAWVDAWEDESELEDDEDEPINNLWCLDIEDDLNVWKTDEETEDELHDDEEYEKESMKKYKKYPPLK